MWDLSSLLRYWTCVPSDGWQSLNHWTTREVAESTWTVYYLPSAIFLYEALFLYTFLVSLIGEGNGTHSSTLAWKIPWTEEPGRLQSLGSLRVGHNWATSLSLFTFMHWRRKWQPTPVFLPGESQGWESLVGCRLWGCTELDTTDVT